MRTGMLKWYGHTVRMGVKGILKTIYEQDEIQHGCKTCKHGLMFGNVWRLCVYHPTLIDNDYLS